MRHKMRIVHHTVTVVVLLLSVGCYRPTAPTPVPLDVTWPGNVT